MQPTPAVNPFINMVPLVLIFVIFYFLIIRPQKNKEAEHRKMIESVGKNDEIVTTGGIHGTVINVKDRTIILRIDENVKIEIEKTSIGYVKKSQRSGGGIEK